MTAKTRTTTPKDELIEAADKLMMAIAREAIEPMKLSEDENVRNMPIETRLLVLDRLMKYMQIKHKLDPDEEESGLAGMQRALGR